MDGRPVRNRCSLKIGIGIGTAADATAAARDAEAAGFDYVHCGEHLFFHGPTPHALTTLAVAAGATTRIRLLSAVTLAPLYPAVVIAKIATTLDRASNGRLDLGLGVGGEFPSEFAAAGVHVHERGARTDESLQILRELFGGQQVNCQGRWAQLDGLRLQPAPVQPRGPRLWLAGRKGAALRRAGRFADVWMPYMVTPHMFRDGLEAVRGAAIDAGRERADIDAALYGFISVHSDGVKARTSAGDVVSRLYRQPADRLTPYLIAGTPEQCVAQLRAFEQAGASSAQLTVACPTEEAESMTRLLATEVLTAVQSHDGPHRKEVST